MIGEPTSQTKGWNAKVLTSGLTLRDKEKLRKIYNIPYFVNIKIPSPSVLDNMTLLEDWKTFHKKYLWLEIKFYLYPFIREFLMRT